MRIQIVLQNVIIAICSIIPFSCSKPKANLSEVQTVYITTQQESKIFHANSECKGLDNYSGDLYLADLDDLLITEYHPCGYCFNIIKLPNIPLENPHWIERPSSLSGSRNYYGDDIKYVDGYYFLSYCIDHPDNNIQIYTYFIYDRTLTKYRAMNPDVVEDFFNEEPQLFPLIKSNSAANGAEFIKSQLSWKKAIMNVVPE